MMNTLKTSLLSSLIVLVGVLSAGERPPESEIEPVKPLTHAERVQKKEQWLKLNRENPVEKSHIKDQSKLFKTQDVSSSDVKVWTFYPEAANWIENIGVCGDWIKMVDGSKWQIALSDQYEVSTWWYNDEVYVSQSDSLLGSYDYMIVNKTRGKHVYANRLTKPAYYGAYTRYIVAVDRFADRILLNDGTWWNVSWLDDSIMQRWCENHTVIVGLNCGFDRYTYPFILINVGIDTYDLGLDEWVSAQLSY